MKNYSVTEEIEKYAVSMPNIIGFDFTRSNPDIETANKILALIDHLAHIKDPLKKALKNKGADPDLIENEIKKQPFLQILLDLANSKKHGYPLEKYKHSGRDPKIVNIRKEACIAVSEENSYSMISFDVQTGKPIVVGDVSIMIDADIVDLQGGHICTLGVLASKSLVAWEDLIQAYGLLKK
jgi:hypothetical protein